MASGRFITFEGGEGTGKSTQARLLAERLRAAGRDVLLTREPGGSPFAEAIRDLLLDPKTPPHSAMSEALLFYAARADHLERTIRPALNQGRWVICDRFSDSTRVYQGLAGGLSEADIVKLEQLVVHPTVPDLTVILDLDVVVGMARVEQRRVAGPSGQSTEVDPYEARNLRFHENLREAFLTLARADPRRCVIVNAFQSVDQITAEIEGHINARFRGRAG